MNRLCDAYAGRRVLVTGHTGFKGAWLSLWLHHLGANVVGYSDGIPTNPSMPIQWRPSRSTPWAW